MFCHEESGQEPGGSRLAACCMCTAFWPGCTDAPFADVPTWSHGGQFPVEDGCLACLMSTSPTNQTLPLVTAHPSPATQSPTWRGDGHGLIEDGCLPGLPLHLWVQTGEYIPQLRAALGAPI